MKESARLPLKASRIAVRGRCGVLTTCLVLAQILAVGTAARAQIVFEQKITASGATSNNSFGTSVAISGHATIVGAPYAAVFSSGSAYLFDVTTGNQLFKLTAADSVEQDQFGNSVGISGNTAIVGAHYKDEGPFSEAGSAYLFDVTTGNQLFKLTAGDDARSDDFFGTSVAISGNMAIVGAPFDEDVVSAAYVFDVTTGNRLLKLNSLLDPPDVVRGSGDDQFGRSVGISGNTAIVGAPKGGSAEEVRGGTAYLFDVNPLSPTFGKELFKLSADDAEPSEEFGNSVAISGNTAIVGALFDDHSGESSGSAYLFDVTTGNQLFKLTASDAGPGDRFGESVAISGNTAIVGAYHNDDACGDLLGCNSGSAYLFDVTTGEQLAKLTAPDAAELDIFGFVGISGGTAVVGAPGGNPDSAYLFAIPLVPEPIGDFDGNGNVNAADIDLLTKEIIAGTNNSAFDLTGDGSVNEADLTRWRRDGATHNGFSEPYLLGDSNLDGLVDSTDLNNLALNWQQGNALWSGGDFTADGVANSADLNDLAFNWRQSIPIGASDSAPVPEPSALCLTLIFLGVCHLTKRLRNNGHDVVGQCV